MSGVVDSLSDCMDSVLGVRDSVGAVKAPVYLITRTWDGTEPGDGAFSDTEVRILPSPQVVSLDSSIRSLEGGAVQYGDIRVKHISKNKFGKSQLDGSSSARNIEKFYKVGEDYYQVLSVQEDYLWWNVMLRKTTDQTRES